MDERHVAKIAAIRDRMEHLAELDKRREVILKSLEERGLLNQELQEKIPGREPKPGGKSSTWKPPATGKEREAGPFNNPFVKAFRKEK